MSDSRHTTADDVYFVTLTVSGWIDLFSRDTYKKILVQNLEHCQKHESLEIFSYVIMTNHLHMLTRRMDNDLNELLGRFKGFTSKEMLKEIQENPKESRKEWLLHQFKFFAQKNAQYSKYHLWQNKNYPTQIYSPEVFMQKMNYIHQNPVRAGMVTDPAHYIYSSACPDSPLEMNRW